MKQYELLWKYMVFAFFRPHQSFPFTSTIPLILPSNKFPCSMISPEIGTLKYIKGFSIPAGIYLFKVNNENTTQYVKYVLS